MTLYEAMYQVLILLVTVVHVHSDTMLSNIAALVHDTVQDPIMNDLPLPGIHGPLPPLPEAPLPPFFNQQMLHMASKIPDLSGPKVPIDVILSSERTNMSPPIAPSKYLTLPQFPIGFVDLNQSKDMFAPTQKDSGYISIPPGSPVNFLQVPDWKSYMPPGSTLPKSPHQHAIGLVVQGPVLDGKPSEIQVDPVHHLPMNHLFVPVPVADVSAKGPMAGNLQKGKTVYFEYIIV